MRCVEEQHENFTQKSEKCEKIQYRILTRDEFEYPLVFESVIFFTFKETGFISIPIDL